MYYFITKRQDLLTSSIETAEVKRLKIFDSLKQPAKIITLLYNFDHQLVERKLGIPNRVINLFQYFQQLPYHSDQASDSQLIESLLHQPGYTVKDLIAYKNDKKRIQIVLYHDRLYSANYYDQYGFMDHSDYYDCGCLSYSDFYEDKGRKVTTQYYNAQGRPILSYYYRGGENNYPVLSLIRLEHQGKLHLLDNEAELYAYFFDQIAQNDSHAIFINDRSDTTLNAFKLMQQQIPKYQVFHSSFTLDGQADGKLFDVYQPISQMLKDGSLSGLISSTKQEAREASLRFDTDHSYAIPVTYVDPDTLSAKFDLKKRIPGQIIAVARVATVKRLDHLISTVIALHHDFPFIDLKIYGYDDNSDNENTPQYLRQLVNEQGANDYIHFCGYTDDLTQAYQTADMEVLTSQFEGFAMALLEAQSYGCPVVSYDINYGPSEIITNHQSGQLIAPSTSLLYQTIRALLSDRSKLNYFSKHAQASVAPYSFANLQKTWLNFLKAEKLPLI